MPFPTTPILDTFNAGALQNLTARTGWNAGVPRTGHTTGATDAVPTKALCSGSNRGNYWNTSATDCECYCTFADLTFVSGQEFELLTRITAVGSPTAYFLRIISGSPTEFTICKWVTGTGSTVGTSKAVTVAAGDSIGIQAIGTTISSWYNPAGAGWVQKDSLTDSSVTGSGFVGGFLNFGTDTANMDSFGGGAFVAQTFQSLSLTGVGN